ncbi:mitochondrial ribosomal protein S23 [Megalopta genalis]|uniref:mitochondrial ribosomal protein S23 n=1 Tax=Megalopta genalis TaxID=115081 RepID=UPI003FCF5A7A
MAHSRAEKIGTVFSRMTALVKGGAITESNIPIWYNIYKAFPPKYEPLYSRPASKKPIRDIFYEEDILRAKFHEDVRFLQPVNLKSKKHSETQFVLNTYSEYLKEGFSETEAYEKIINLHYHGKIRSSKP